MDITDASTIPETSHLVAALLHEDGLAHLTFQERPHRRPMHSLDKHLPPDEGVTRRIVIAMLPDRKEIMVAMEGTGCIFVSAETNLNEFVFIQQGFNHAAAVALANLFSCMAQFHATLQAHTKLLQHDDRS